MTGIEIAIGAGLAYLFLGGGKGGNVFTGKSTTQGKADDEATLISRADQPRAARWTEDFEAAGATPQVAEALARWAGIESGGNPMAVSVLNERGLMQASQKMGRAAFTNNEWDAILNPETTRLEQATLAMQYVKWMEEQVSRRVKNMPKEPLDRLWYARLWHQYPKDVVQGRLHGPARLQAMELQHRWKAPKQSHRLRAANVVAFGEGNV